MDFSYLPQISIIAPVFNVAPYLESFIKSVENQTFSEWELILVDDGSTDNSLSILEKFAAHNQKIRVLKKTNQGVNSARNLGLRYAKGNYLNFVDPDDLIPPRAYDILFERAQKDRLDIVIGQQYTTYDLDFKLTKIAKIKIPVLANNYQERVCTWQDFDFDDFYHSLYFTIVRNKLFTKDLWHNISFHETIHMAEDQITIKEVTLHAKRIGIVPDYVYVYRKRPNSATTTRSNKAFDVFKSYSALDNIYKNKQLPAAMSLDLKKYFFHTFLAHMIYFTPFKLWYTFLKQIRNVVNSWQITTLSANYKVDDSLVAMQRFAKYTNWQLLVVLSKYHLRFCLHKILHTGARLFKAFTPQILQNTVYKILSVIVGVLLKIMNYLE